MGHAPYGHKFNHVFILLGLLSSLTALKSFTEPIGINELHIETLPVHE